MHVVKGIFGYLAVILLALIMVGCGPESAANNSQSETQIYLSDLSIEGLELDQTFQPEQYSYTGSVNYLITSFSITPVVSDSAVTITVNGTPLVSGETAGSIALAEGANLITLQLSSAEGATTSYSLEVTRASVDDFSQQEFLKASDTEAGDEFGENVAIDGDTLVVSAPDHDNDDDTTGAVYVFARDGSSWTEQAVLDFDMAEHSDNLGVGVAISGDTIAVSDGKGYVYIFERSGTSWTQQTVLDIYDIYDIGGIRSSGLFFMRLNAIAISGDTLLVGMGEFASSTLDKAVFFTRNEDRSWSEPQFIQPDDDYDNFGYSVAIDGDRLVIGSFSDRVAHVYEQKDGSWIEQQILEAVDGGNGDGFGHSVAIYGDTLVVGAPEESEPNGAAYVFVHDGEQWSLQDHLSANPSLSVDTQPYFGAQVALHGDVLAVSAPYATGTLTDPGSSDLTNSGAAYVFIREGDAWVQQVYLKASNAEQRDYFATGMALDGSTGTLVVGAPYESSSVSGGQADNNANRAGAVYVFE